MSSSSPRARQHSADSVHACVRACLCVSTLHSLFLVFSAQHLRVSQTSPLPATLTKRKEKPPPPPSLNLLLISSSLSPPKQLEPQQTRPRENTSDPSSPPAVDSGEEQGLVRVAATHTGRRSVWAQAGLLPGITESTQTGAWPRSVKPKFFFPRYTRMILRNRKWRRLDSGCKFAMFFFFH